MNGVIADIMATRSERDPSTQKKGKFDRGAAARDRFTMLLSDEERAFMEEAIVVATKNGENVTLGGQLRLLGLQWAAAISWAEKKTPPASTKPVLPLRDEVVPRTVGPTTCSRVSAAPRSSQPRSSPPSTATRASSRRP